MERSIGWRMHSIWYKFHSFMLLSPNFKMVVQISPSTACKNWGFLAKTCKWNMLFHQNVSNRKTGLPFQNSTYSWELSSGTPRKCVFHQHANWKFRNFWVNEKCPRSQHSPGVRFHNLPVQYWFHWMYLFQWCQILLLGIPTHRWWNTMNKSDFMEINR